MSTHPFARVVAAAVSALLGTAALGQNSDAGAVRPETLPQGFVIVVEDVSQAASESRPMYLAGAHNSWDPGDEQYRLEPRSDKRWQIAIEGGEFGVNSEFKFTLGGWATVETDAEGQDIPNRTLPPVDMSGLREGERPVIELTVPKFRTGDEGYIIAPEYQPIEAVGTVKRLQVAGGAGMAQGEMRDLRVWLPPGYEDEINADRTYPVLYMLDGQNLFQNHSGVPAEWRLDETATALINAGLVEPFIAVGVPSLAEARRDEYIPPVGGAGRHGDVFGHWFKTQAMPRVERAFRVKTGPEHTAIGGASLGGLFALYAGHAMPDVFGGVLAESPALRFNTDDGGFSIVGWLNARRERPQRVFIGMGGAEHLEGSGFYDRDSQRHVRAAASLYEGLSREGVDASLSLVGPHMHDENAWAARLPAALTHLFPVQVQ